ncbi:MAG: hypothetical protein CMH48_01635 [Muricauda sp.]|nr:hypothetical protein [Allomuricauda sp.]MBC29523.1 hypothetical protein [Allomuricauda sp.]
MFRQRPPWFRGGLCVGIRNSAKKIEICHVLPPGEIINLALLNLMTMNALLTLPLVSWDNGILMIGVFALVVVFLVVAVVAMMNSGKK